jgi:hypothetical protein
MEQTPPSFPSPEELKSKIAEFMKANFGDRVSFATYTSPEPAETGTEEKVAKVEGDEFVFNFLPRDIKAHLDRFVIKQEGFSDRGLRSLQPRQIPSSARTAGRGSRRGNRVREAERDPGWSDRCR